MILFNSDRNYSLAISLISPENVQFFRLRYFECIKMISHSFFLYSVKWIVLITYEGLQCFNKEKYLKDNIVQIQLSVHSWPSCGSQCLTEWSPFGGSAAVVEERSVGAWSPLATIFPSVPHVLQSRFWWGRFVVWLAINTKYVKSHGLNPNL